MSGYPNTEGIKSLRYQLERLAEADYELEVAKQAIITANERLEKAKRNQHEAVEEIDKLMHSMDIASPGNAGYKNRLLSMLVGLTQERR